MPRLLIPAIICLLLVSSVSAQSTDTLLDVRQWPVAEGGNDHYYGIIPIVQPWVDQNELAQSLSYGDEPGYLATILSAEENAFIESLMADHTDQPSITDEFFIGGNAFPGDWQWGTGEPFVYANWNAGEPSGDGPALAIWGMSQGLLAGTWNDVLQDTLGQATHYQLWAIVEFGPPEGIDTLYNLTQWPSAQGGNDHWYAVLTLELFWEEADSAAGTFVLGNDTGYLATTTSAPETQFILNNMIPGLNQQSILDQFWLGGSYVDGAFGWQTPEPFVYTNWAPGEPNNLPDETAMTLWGFGEPDQVPGTWNNALPNDDIHDLHRWWALVEFGAPDTTTPTFDTLIDVRQWAAAEGGNDHYYGIIAITQPWINQEALAGTLQHNGDTGYLATITTPDENSFIESLMADHTDQPSVNDQFYLGGYRTGGVWGWLSGETFAYQPWAVGEPSGDGPALAIWGMSNGSRSGRWNDVAADTAGTNSLQQLWALVEFGLPDTTTPTFDTLIDVRQWTAAEGGNDHYYGIIAIVQPWVNHESLARTLVWENEQGYLATIGSSEENEFVKSLMADHTNQPSIADEFYLGGDRLSGSWGWGTDEDFSYYNWAPGEPNGDGPALAIWGMSQGSKAGFWNDVAEDTVSAPVHNQLWALVEFGGPCCQGVTGNVNDDPQGLVNMTDLTILVNYLFVDGPLPSCPAAANTSGDVGCLISLTDLTLLVNHLFVTFEPLAACNPSCE